MKLIILLIVLKILSSLFQNLRDGGRQPSPSRGPAKQRPTRLPVPPDIFDFPPFAEMPAGPAAEKETEPVRKTALDKPRQSSPYRDETFAEQARSFTPAPAKKRRGAVSPRVVRSQKTTRSNRQKRELAKLLKGDNLPLSLIASEVLSPPRARRSFYTARAGK